MGCGASTQRHPDKAAEEEEAKRKADPEVGWDLWMAYVVCERVHVRVTRLAGGQSAGVDV